MSERLQRGLGWASVALAAEALVCRVPIMLVTMLRNGAHRGWQWPVLVILGELLLWLLLLGSGALLVKGRRSGVWVSLLAAIALGRFGLRWARDARPLLELALTGALAHRGGPAPVQVVFFLIVPLLGSVIYPWILAAGLLVPPLLAAQRAHEAPAPAEMEADAS